ncbi:MAG: Panacea domain-containing protein [Thermodesulfobacteriota bacterium]|nr:Panacea domain-containing protein [Thermodesulfobacteriota bacterium]
MKLLYFFDFIHFRQTGKSVTGQDYFAWDKGPVPVEAYKDLTGKEDKVLGLKKIATLVPKGENFLEVKAMARAKFDKKVFSEREFLLLKQVAEIFRDARAKDMVEVTHLKNFPWEKTKNTKGIFKRIDYELSLDGSEDQLNFEIIKERQAEIAEMERLFGK